VEIKLESYEVEEALKEYIKNKYKLDVEMFSDYGQKLWLETNERVWVYKKHKNGRIKTDPEHGYKIVDYDKSTWNRKFESIGEMSSITFEVDSINEEDASE
tara:strand:- start:89 stop:391 length:303 start_codon:yes stop_codon:yes gene_type:complete